MSLHDDLFVFVMTIKFQLSQLIIDSFLQLAGRMLLIRLFTSSSTLLPTLGFGFASIRPSHLHNTILTASNTREFFDLYEANKEKIDGDAIGSVSKHLTSLLSDRDERFSFAKLTQFLGAISARNPSTFSHKTLYSILPLLRTIKSKNLYLSTFQPLCDQVIKSYIAQHRTRAQAGETQLNQLISGYFELASLGDFSCKTLAAKILDQLQAKTEQNQLPISNSQISYLLNALSIRIDLSYQEQQIRKTLLRYVAIHLQKTKLRELVKFTVSIMRFQNIDMTFEELGIIKEIANRLIDNITELQEGSLYELLRAEYNMRSPAFNNLYHTISTNVFEEINDNGETDLDTDAVFKIISFLGSRISFSMLPEIHQNRLFAFLQLYAKQEGGKKYAARLTPMISNGSFKQQNQKAVIIEIFQKSRVQPSLALLYELAINNYDISSFSSLLTQYGEIQLEENAYKIGIIASRLAANNAQVQALHQKILQQVTKQIAGPEEFVRLVRELKRKGISLADFHEAFSQATSHLSNPFTANQQSPVKPYRYNYLNYFVQGIRNSKQFNAFLDENKDGINDRDLANVIARHFSAEERPKQIQINRSILTCASRLCPRAIQNKDRRGLEACMELLDKYHRLVVVGRLEISSQQQILNIFHSLLDNLPLLKELKCDYRFNIIIEKFICKNFRRYHLESKYKKIIRHVLENIHLLPNRRSPQLVLKEGLKLNLVTKAHLQHISQEEINRMPFYVRSRALFIKDSTSKPAIDKIQLGSLQIIFSNPNLESLVVQNEADIIKLVCKAHLSELCSYISSFAHSLKSSSCRRVLTEILKCFNNSKTLEGQNWLLALQNLYNLNFSVQPMKVLYDRVVDELKNNVSKYDFETHYQFIKLAISQPTLNPRDYYNRLVDYIKHDKNMTDWHYTQILVRLASTNYMFKDEELKYIPRVIQRNASSGLYFFMMVEQMLDAQTCSQLASLVAQCYKKVQEGDRQRNVNFLQYQYIKKKYPTETASFNIQPDQFFYQKFSSEFTNPRLIEIIKQLTGSQPEQLKEFGPQNHIIKIKDFVLIVLNIRKLGSYYEHQFLKRAIPLIRGQNLNVICLHPRTPYINALQYINTSAPNFLDQELFKKIIEQAKAAQEKQRQERFRQKEKHNQEGKGEEGKKAQLEEQEAH